MAVFMKPYSAQTYALLRMVSGFLFLWHGASKLFGFPPSAHTPPPAIAYTAGPIELIAGALIMIGLFTRWGAFLASGTMAVAYWIGHGTKAALPLQNGGELAVIYCFVFLFIAAHGAGIWSIDGRD